MAITRISQSSVTEGLEKYISFYGGLSGALFGQQYDSIQTITVGAGGQAAIDFTSIPGTYQHLQLRVIARHTSVTTGNDSINIRLNSDSGSNYAVHRIYGNGVSAVADAATGQTAAWTLIAAHGGNSASTFAVGILDILDYSSSAKTTTLRALVGGDFNGSGSVNINGSLWTSTAAVSAMSLTPGGAYNFAQHTTAALYGIRS